METFDVTFDKVKTLLSILKYKHKGKEFKGLRTHTDEVGLPTGASTVLCDLGILKRIGGHGPGTLWQLDSVKITTEIIETAADTIKLIGKQLPKSTLADESNSNVELRLKKIESQIEKLLKITESYGNKLHSFDKEFTNIMLSMKVIKNETLDAVREYLQS